VITSWVTWVRASELESRTAGGHAPFTIPHKTKGAFNRTVTTQRLVKSHNFDSRGTFELVLVWKPGAKP